MLDLTEAVSLMLSLDLQARPPASPVVGVLTSQTTKRMHEAGVFVAVNDYHELLDLVKKHVPYDEECDVKFK